MENGKKIRQASRRKYHYIYQTTCIITGRYYIGMHSTDNLEDGYIGSGKRLWHSINKYGKENHQTEILEFLPTREELKQREAKIVNEELIGDVMCLNLQLGGGGGFVNEEHHRKMRKGSSKWSKKAWEDGKFENNKKTSSKRMKSLHSNGILKYNNFTGRTHTEETKKKMSDSSKGKGAGNKNSQFGTCWIHNVETKRCIKIKNTEIDSYISEGWTKGRKMKF